MRLETYDISEDADMLHAKLLTTKRGGCDGSHCMEEGSLGSFRCFCASLAQQLCCIASPEAVMQQPLYARETAEHETTIYKQFCMHGLLALIADVRVLFMQLRGRGLRHTVPVPAAQCRVRRQLRVR